ncbi:MAG: ADOP family duplicated permease [Vicinamibacterales bacterium]
MDDIRSAWRALRNAPLLSSSIVLSLALGLGANTAIFSVVNALLLRPLPVRNPDRLVTVSSAFALGHGFKAGAGMNYDMWLRMNERLQAFEDGFAWAPGRVDLSQGGEVQPADALFASGGFFSTLGVPPLLGRAFTRKDDVRGGGPDGLVVVISYALWQRRFGGSGSVLGASLPIDGVPCSVIGVMPPAFLGIEIGQPFDVAIPLALEPAIRGARASLHHPAALMLTVMLRLRENRSLETATSALRAAQPDILGMSGGETPRGPQYLREPYVLVPAATGTSDRSGLRRQYARPLMTVLAVVLLVLIVACVNIANLLLARATSRRHEMSVRLALGASRWRLARLHLAESLVLALISAAVALLFAYWASRAVVAGLSTVDGRIALDLSFDWRVMAVTGIVALATAVLFGTGPALTASRADPIRALRDQRTISSRAGLSMSLVAAQVAVSLVLLICAGLLLSTFRRLATLPLGFDPDRVLVVQVDTARAHSDASTRMDYFARLLEVTQSVPGVSRAAGSTITPFSDATKSPLFSEPGRVREHVVSPGFFETYGIDLRAGRDFDRSDAATAHRVVIVSEGYVRQFLEKRHPLGATIDTGPCGPRAGRCTIVGVVRDVVFGAPRSGARPTLYFPLAQSGGMVAPVRTSVSISVRAGLGSPARLAPSVADALMNVDRRLAFSFRPLEQDVRVTFVRERLLAAVSGFFAALALLLSGLGLYGVTAYAVARRRAEIGIRLALGATGRGVVTLIVSRFLLVVAVGLLVGVVGALWASSLIASLLHGVGPRDPSTLLAAAAILAGIATISSVAGALRAARIQPAEVLRQV